MPAFFTHKTIADRVLSRLPTDIFDKITCAACYYAGAQGADPFFIYRPFKRKGYNLGKLMHRVNTLDFFKNAKNKLVTDGGENSYIFGYITHYAVDITFHPYVYNLERRLRAQLPPRRRKDNLHSLIERDLDSFIFERYENADLKTYDYLVTLTDADVYSIFKTLDDVIWKTYAIRLDYDGVRNSILRFFNRQKAFLDVSGNKFRTFYALETLLFLPHILSYLYVRDNPNPQFTGLDTDVNVYTLADKAIDLSVTLIKSFAAAKDGDELDFKKFGEDFNVGKNHASAN